MKHANIKQAHPENHCVIQAFGKSNKSKAFQRKVTLRPSQRNCKDSKGGGGVWFHTSVEGLDVPKSKCPVYENSQLLLQNGMEKKQLEVLEYGANSKKHDMSIFSLPCAEDMPFKLGPRHRQPHGFANAANDALLGGAKEAKFEDRTWEQTKLAAQNGTKEL